MGSLAHLITRKWVAGLLALFAILGTGAVIGLVGQAESPATGTAALPNGTDSREAALLRDQLPQAEGSAAVVLYSSDQALTPEELALVQERAQSLPGATGAPAVVADDGTAATVFVPVTTADAVETADVVTELRTAATADLPDGLTAQVTGPAAIQADLAAVFDGANFRLLAATASVVAILLVITYRSPFLWLVPLTVVGVADQLAAVLATHTLAAFGVLWDESTIGILSVLVFGAGTDYALLLISRYRDQLRVIDDRREAMAVALTRTAEAVLSSATTVVLGLLTLLLSLFPATRGLGPGLCGRCRRGRLLRARRAARRPGRLRALDLLAQGARTSARPGWPTAGRSGARWATPLPSAPPASSPSPSSCWVSWPVASPRSRPASTRPTSSCRSPRRSRQGSGWRSPSRREPPTRPT